MRNISPGRTTEPSSVTASPPTRLSGISRSARGSGLGVVGLSGLGHMAVKLAASMGAEVTVFSTSKTKEQDAHCLGAQDFVVSLDPKNLDALANQFDFILDAVSAPHDVNAYLNLLRWDGVMAMVGFRPSRCRSRPSRSSSSEEN